MDKEMRIIKDNKNTIIEGVSDFNITQTLECGQCFRFDKIDENEYVVVAKKHLLHIKQQDDRLIFYDTDKSTVEEVWVDYFDLNRDYTVIKDFLIHNDERLEAAIQEKYGIHILNQEFYEMLISFIISQNKQIPHIKKIIKDLSKRYGEYLGEVNGEKYYAFPTIAKLGEISEDEYREIKTGFRAPYLRDASKHLNEDLTYDMLKKLCYEDAKSELIKIKGVGDKVANCVLLFGLGHRNAFPVDVWVKRIMEHIYFKKDTSKEIIAGFAKKQYGEYGGYAQQYLFYYARDNELGKK